MSPRAKELLVKLVSSYDSNRNNDFDSLFYYDFDDGVINELDYLGYIVKQNDIVGTIKLTQAGYEAAKR